MTRAQHFFKNEDIENFMTWWFGIVFNSRETIQKMLRSDDMEEFFFKRKDTESVMIWWVWKKFILKRKDTGNLMIWWLGGSLFSIGRSLFSREEILKTLGSDDLEKLLFKRKRTETYLIWSVGRNFFSSKKILKTFFIWWRGRSFFFERRDTKSFRIRWFGEAYIQEKRYWNLSDMMSWKKPIFKRIDTENFMIWRFGKRFFFQTENYSKLYGLLTWRSLYSRKRILKSFWFDVM